jgi:prevent-host-death family protein
MKRVSARQANHDFCKLLSRVERGEEILITKWSKPVALLSLSAAAVDTGTASGHQATIEVMAQGLPWGAAVRTTRDEMHER